MKKVLLTIVVIVVAALVVFTAAKDVIIKSAVEAGGKFVLGADVKIEKFSLSILKQKAEIEGFKIFNPKGYPYEPMVDIAEVAIQVDIGELLKKKIHLPVVVLKMNEIVVVKNKEGKLNVDALKVTSKTEEKPSETKAAKPKAKEDIPLLIDAVTVTLGKVVMKDFTAGDKPKVDVYESPVKDKTYKNIDSAQKLAMIILGESLRGTAIKSAVIYGAAALTGVGLIPLAVGSIFADKDSVQQVFRATGDELFTTAKTSLAGMGKITAEDKNDGTIKASVSGSSVTVKIIPAGDKESKIVISARKMMLPQQGIAGGILRDVEARLAQNAEK